MKSHHWYIVVLLFICVLPVVHAASTTTSLTQIDVVADDRSWYTYDEATFTWDGGQWNAVLTGLSSRSYAANAIPIRSTFGLAGTTNQEILDVAQSLWNSSNPSSTSSELLINLNSLFASSDTTSRYAELNAIAEALTASSEEDSSNYVKARSAKAIALLLSSNQITTSQKHFFDQYNLQSIFYLQSLINQELFVDSTWDNWNPLFNNLIHFLVLANNVNTDLVIHDQVESITNYLSQTHHPPPPEQAPEPVPSEEPGSAPPASPTPTPAPGPASDAGSTPGSEDTDGGSATTTEEVSGEDIAEPEAFELVEIDNEWSHWVNNLFDDRLREYIQRTYRAIYYSYAVRNWVGLSYQSRVTGFTASRRTRAAEPLTDTLDTTMDGS